MPFTKGHKINVGRSSWNAGIKWPEHSKRMKGQEPWNKGKHLSDAHREALRKSHLGLHNSPATQFEKGYMPHNKGKHHITKEKHWNWQGGISEENRTERQNFMQTLEYKIWRRSVFERDDYTCQECGQHGGELHADHIKSYAKYPKLRLEISNGRTLCISCHRKTPNFGGRK